MKWSTLASVVFHASLLLLAYIGTSERREVPTLEETAVFVDIVPLGETSNPPPPAKSPPQPPKAAPKPEPKAAAPKPAPPAPPPPPEPKVAAPPPPPEPAPKPAPPPEPEVAEPEPRPEPKPKPEPAKKDPAPKPQPEPKVAETPPPAVKPEAKPEPEPEVPPPLLSLRPKVKPKAPAQPVKEKPEPEKEKEPEKPADFASVLDAVADLAKETPSKEDRPTSPAPPSESPRSSSPHNPNLSVSMTEVDLVRRQIERCWNVPAGAKDMQNMAVEVRVEMNPDGTPRTAVVEDRVRMRTDPYYRAAAESALRAVLNPRCHPFKLPAEKYDRWRTMTVVFDPKEMFGT